MTRSSLILLPALSIGVLAGIGAQQVLPAPLAGHLKALQAAKSLTGTVTVQPLPGTASSIKFSFARPNLYKVETSDSVVQSDGKNIYHYAKATNTYSVSAVSDSSVSADAKAPETWVWSAFFAKQAYENLSSAKTGAKRTIKGHAVTEVALSWEKPEPGTCTVYVDDKTGVAWGFNLKKGDKEWLVIAEDLKLGQDDADASLFAFSPPSGAQKVEATVVASGTGYKAIQAIFDKNCMPCHNSDRRSGRVDLSSYAALPKSTVNAGDPDNSGLYTAISGSNPSMPKNRAPLSDADRKVIFDWIKNGAKND